MSRHCARLLRLIFLIFYLFFIFQEQTLRKALTGVDMLAKAKTGTGKTLAFLIPSIQQAAAAKEKGSKSIKVQKKFKKIIYNLSLIDLEPYTKKKHRCCASRRRANWRRRSMRRPSSFVVSTPSLHR